MGARSKYHGHKPTIFRCNARINFSFPFVVFALVAFVIVLQLFSIPRHRAFVDEDTQLRIDQYPHFRELVQLEEAITIPPPRKRSARAMKRKPKKLTTLNEEFLDETSQFRPMFFPDMKTVLDPLKEVGNDSYYYYPGRVWLDTDGKPIQAHGGGILNDERSKVYYWYGEYKDGSTYRAHKKGPARVDIIGVGCYSSTDLWGWKFEGVVLPAEETDETHDLYKSNVLERPKVIYNDKTRKYVMWMHIDDANYTKASVGVAVSDYPTGPFKYLYSQKPHGFDSRDMTIFKDDDGVAYLIYSSEDNTDLHIGPLTHDYLDVTSEMRKILPGQHREAPALFKHGKTYYMITSGCTGWGPNEALAHAAETITGPWETLGNPCVGWKQNIQTDNIFFSRYICVAFVWSSWFIYIHGGSMESSRFKGFEIPMASITSWRCCGSSS